MAPDRAGYPRHSRLSRGKDLRRVLREGKRARSEHLDVRMLASLLRHPRVGIIVPKHRHSGVDRNRLKRQLREIIRQEILPVISGSIDLVVRANPRAYAASYSVLRAAVANDVKEVMAQDGR